MNATPATLTDLPPLLRFHRAVETFREHDPAASTILLQVFVIVANHPPHSLTPTEVARKLNIKQASMTHNVSRLGSGGREGPRLGGDYLGLIETRAHPTDGRQNTLGLTAKGRNLAGAMARSLQGRD